MKTPPDILIASAPGIGHFVRSRSHPDCYRLVYGSGCTCPAKGGCWHIAAVLDHVRSIEATKLPPLSVGTKADPALFND